MHNIFKILTLATVLLTAHPAWAVSDKKAEEKNFATANEAYENGDYAQAVETYNDIIRNGFESWQLYYNLGNAYYRLDSIGRCILSYERALRLAPNKQLIKDNLELARSKTTDKIEVLPKMFLVQWTDAVVRITTPRGWRIIFLSLFFLTLSALCIFLIAKDYRFRKTSFVLTVILAILTIFSILNAAISAKNVTNNMKAVVIAPMVVVKSSPDAKSVDKFLLHEGTLLTIDDKQDQWWQITIDDGKNGWINYGAEII